MKITSLFIAVALSLVLMTPHFSVAENLFKNSSMDTTSSWKGDRKYGSDGDNRILILKANPRKTVMFYQDVDTRGIKDVVFKLRYKSDNYEGRGYQTRVRRSDGGSTFRTRQITADGKWHEVTWEFSAIRGSNKVRFSIELLDGEGEVYFDDFTVEPK